MNKPAFVGTILLLLLFLYLFNSCKNEIPKSEFEKGSGNLLTFFNIDSVDGVTPFAQFNRPGGGYIIIYQPGQVNDLFGRLYGAVAVLTDKDGNIIHSEYLGGAGNTVIWGAEMDDFGNVYLCGETNSKDIRDDMWVDSTGVDKVAFYLGKVDKDARVLWEKAFSDSATPHKGKDYESFWEIEIINNKPICIGSIDLNYDTKVGPVLFDFDENGSEIRHRLLPPLYKGHYSFGGVVETAWFTLIKLPDNDLIIRDVHFIFQPVGGYPDTGSHVMRYNPVNDQIKWEKYFSVQSKQGDLSYCGLLGNGNVAFFDNYFNTLNILDSENGNILRTETIHTNSYTGTSNNYYNPNPYMRSTIDGELYFTGAMAKGSTTNGRKPFVIKLNYNGTIAFERIYNIPETGFYYVSKNENNNLQFLGAINIFRTNRQKIFTAFTDKNGNPVSD